MRILRRHGELLWSVDCPHCGAYRFDAAFGDLVAHARSRSDLSVLRYVTRLSSVVRNVESELTITRENYVTLVHEFD